jgi:5-hydroxyisourate hydrolase
MAGGISIHAVDVASGCPAEGLCRCGGEPARIRIAEGSAKTASSIIQSRGFGIEAGECEVLFTANSSQAALVPV